MMTHSRTGVDWLTLNPKTDFFRFQRLTNSLLFIAFLLQHRAVPMETLAVPLLVAMQPTCTQQYRSGGRIHVTTRPRLLGNHATRQYRVVGVSMEVFNFRLPSNDGIRPNTSQYHKRMEFGKPHENRGLMCTLENFQRWVETSFAGAAISIDGILLQNPGRDRHRSLQP
jgi:hypothetical protein